MPMKTCNHHSGLMEPNALRGTDVRPLMSKDPRPWVGEGTVRRYCGSRTSQTLKSSTGSGPKRRGNRWGRKRRIRSSDGHILDEIDIRLYNSGIQLPQFCNKPNVHDFKGSGQEEKW